MKCLVNSFTHPVFRRFGRAIAFLATRPVAEIVLAGNLLGDGAELHHLAVDQLECGADGHAGVRAIDMLWHPVGQLDVASVWLRCLVASVLRLFHAALFLGHPRHPAQDVVERFTGPALATVEFAPHR